MIMVIFNAVDSAPIAR